MIKEKFNFVLVKRTRNCLTFFKKYVSGAWLKDIWEYLNFSMVNWSSIKLYWREDFGLLKIGLLRWCLKKGKTSCKIFDLHNFGATDDHQPDRKKNFQSLIQKFKWINNALFHDDSFIVYSQRWYYNRRCIPPNVCANQKIQDKKVRDVKE